MPRVFVIVIALVLFIAALVDLAKAPAQVRIKWFLVILIPVLGPLAWFFYGNKPQRGQNRTKNFNSPDDDPDFLWKLEKEIRKRKKKKDEE